MRAQRKERSIEENKNIERKETVKEKSSTIEEILVLDSISTFIDQRENDKRSNQREDDLEKSKEQTIEKECLFETQESTKEELGIKFLEEDKIDEMRVNTKGERVRAFLVLVH